MLKIYLPIFLAFLLYGNCQAQNIIPNGSFEALSNYTCAPDPISGFWVVNDWYSFGTPHFYFKGCPYDEATWHFWDPATSPKHGLNSIGLTGNLLVDGSYGSVVMGAELTTSLKANQEYYFQFFARNNGTWHRIPDSLRICDTDPPKRIQIYFGDQDLLNPTEFNFRTPDFSFTNPTLQAPEDSEWMQFNHCFEASNDLSNFAISMNRGSTNMSLPCEVRGLDREPIYFVYHFDVDDLILYPVPNQLDTTFNSCNRKEIAINLREMAKVPPRVEVVFNWSDGFTGAKRTLAEPGVYTIEAKLACTSFPIEIEIAKEDCLPKIFVPNAFSPNGDGINETLRPFINSPYPIQNYSFMVYDRWGAKVFESNDQEREWDGRSKDKGLSLGVYIWMLQFEVNSQETQYIKEGGEVVLVK